jgi:hypothetical protein
MKPLNNSQPTSKLSRLFRSVVRVLENYSNVEKVLGYWHISNPRLSAITLGGKR